MTVYLVRFNFITATVIQMNNELFNLYFQSLEVVSRHRHTQLQVTENYVIGEI